MATLVVDLVTGADLGTGEEGEVWVRGPQVMKGYLNNSQAAVIGTPRADLGCRAIARVRHLTTWFATQWKQSPEGPAGQTRCGCIRFSRWVA